MIKIFMHLKNQIILIAFALTFTLITFSCDRFSGPDRTPTKEGWKEFTINENGDSLMTFFKKDGTKKSEVTFKNGFHDGVGYTYYDDGVVQYEIHYKEGYKHGETKWFYESGKLYRTTQYNMGSKDGMQRKYYENGNLKSEVLYKDNEPQKGLKEFKEDGTPYRIYPKIKFKEIDKLAFENKIILQVYLKPKGSKTKYYIVKNIGGEDHYISLSQQTKNGKANIEYYLAPGTSVMEKLQIKVVTQTKRGNPLVLHKTYNMAAENRFN